MSAATTTVAHRRRSVLAWITGAAGFAAAVTVVAIAAWPASAADKARDDGEHVGRAVSALYYADSTTEANDALTDLQAALGDTRDHAGDAVADQVAKQQDALARAVEGYVGNRTAGSDWDAGLYQAELEIAVDDLARQADDLRSEGPEVRQAFWDGVDDGLNAG